VGDILGAFLEMENAIQKVFMPGRYLEMSKKQMIAFECSLVSW
jgi:hypothetical protein